MNKYLIFISMLSLFSGLTSPPEALAGSVKGRILENDGRIAIYNFHADEFMEITYRIGGRYDENGLSLIKHVMRSREDDSTHPIDKGVIELMDHLQDHFGAETVEVISGYRSPAYNASLRNSRKGVAAESLHTKGMAVDMHLDEVGEEELFDYVKKLGIGGAGLYPRYAFVHADVGPRRIWEEKPPEERMLVGTDNNPNPAWTAVTDKDVYRPGDELSVLITNNDYGKLSLVRNIWYEYFRKGGWRVRENLIKEKKGAKLDVGESLTYSWKIPADQGLGKYRLVVFTSKDFNIPPAYSNEFYIRK